MTSRICDVPDMVAFPPEPGLVDSIPCFGDMDILVSSGGSSKLHCSYCHIIGIICRNQ